MWQSCSVCGVSLVPFSLLGMVLLNAMSASHCARIKRVKNNHDTDMVEDDEGPTWGCGLLGKLPGINKDGSMNADMQKLVDGIKGSSSMGKVNYWNWAVVPKRDQYLSEDFVFLPNNWGIRQVARRNSGKKEVPFVVKAGTQPIKSTKLTGTKYSPAMMGDLFIGANEPDITGSCMNPGSFGQCRAPCEDDLRKCNGDTITTDCCAPDTVNNTRKQCYCRNSWVTGVGYWPIRVDACKDAPWQPLPTLFKDASAGGSPSCAAYVMQNWRKSAEYVVDKLGFKYLTTPMVAFNMQWVESFLTLACNDQCKEARCGCPQYIGFHYYAYDCMPKKNKNYEGFKERIEAVGELMMKFPSLKGAILNEVGMLNCAAWSATTPICVQNTGEYPAKDQPANRCPSTPDLPNGMSSYMDDIFDMMLEMKTRDGRRIVKQFSWFNKDGNGGTYNELLFYRNNSLHPLGETYIKNCKRWEAQQKKDKEERAKGKALRRA